MSISNLLLYIYPQSQWRKDKQKQQSWQLNIEQESVKNSKQKFISKVFPLSPGRIVGNDTQRTEYV